MGVIARFLVWILAVAVPVVIAACYGMPYRYVRGRVVDARTQKGIKGIEVTCMRGGEAADSMYTWEDGGFEVGGIDSCDEVLARDIDGVDNGGIYAEKTAPVQGDSYVSIELSPEP